MSKNTDKNQFNSKNFWEQNYQKGGTSGAGSYGTFSLMKAVLVNGIITTEGIDSLADLGCGDGNQSSLFSVPNYTGFDVSESAINMCQSKFSDDPSKSFIHSPPGFDFSDYYGSFDATLSMDVLFHLVEQEVFDKYLNDLFGLARKWVIIFSTNEDRPYTKKYSLHRQFTRFVESRFPNWSQILFIPNGYKLVNPDKVPENPLNGYSQGDFFVYKKL